MDKAAKIFYALMHNVKSFRIWGYSGPNVGKCGREELQVQTPFKQSWLEPSDFLDIPKSLDSGRKYWTLNSGCWTLDSGR